MSEVEGKALVEIKYCVTWQLLPTAAWMATEMYAQFGKDLAIQLTPVGQGRYEVYLNGEKIWDKKEAPGRPYPSLGIIHDLNPIVQKALDSVPAGAD